MGRPIRTGKRWHRRGTRQPRRDMVGVPLRVEHVNGKASRERATLAVSLFGRRWTATPSSERETETETETFGKEKDRCACLLLLLRRFFEVLFWAMIFWVFVKSV